MNLNEREMQLISLALKDYFVSTQKILKISDNPMYWINQLEEISNLYMKIDRERNINGQL